MYCVDLRIRTYQDCVKLNLHFQGATGLEMAGFATGLPNKKTGHPLAIREEKAQQIRHYLADLRKRGCIVNTITVKEGILLSKNQSLPQMSYESLC